MTVTDSNHREAHLTHRRARLTMRLCGGRSEAITAAWARHHDSAGINERTPWSAVANLLEQRLPRPERKFWSCRKCGRDIEDGSDVGDERCPRDGCTHEN